MLSKLLCRLFGHKRGRAMPRGTEPQVAVDKPTPGKWFQCPRCSATWFRKAKAKPATIS